eukprot:3952845-Amphidinium_carterae.1
MAKRTEKTGSVCETKAAEQMLAHPEVVVEDHPKAHVLLLFVDHLRSVPMPCIMPQTQNTPFGNIYSRSGNAQVSSCAGS